ncbi:MAG: hypothetical protein ACJ8M4_09835 [Chthoniobacterales bacterium]
MKLKTILSVTLLFVAAATLSFATPDAWMGTWKLNEAKSKRSAGAVKNTKVVYSVEKDGIRIMTEGVDKDGKPMRSVWTGQFDERDYLVALDPTVDTRSYKQIDANTLEFIAKKESQVIATGRVVLSADGKTRTVTTTGTRDGKPFENVAVYDKE